MFNFFDILTYPIILLGLFRGSFLTYKCLEIDDVEKKTEQLEYWVVMSALLFIFPWIDSILGLFLFSGVVGCVKLLLLILVVVGRTNYGFIYKLIEEQFLGFLQPYIQQGLDQSKDFRLCDNTAYMCNYLNHNILHMLLGLMSDNMLYLLKNRVNQSVEGINRELSQRDHNEISSFVDGGGGLSMNESNAKSIFEKASENNGVWSGPSADGLRKRKVQEKDQSSTDI